MVEEAANSKTSAVVSLYTNIVMKSETSLFQKWKYLICRDFKNLILFPLRKFELDLDLDFANKYELRYDFLFIILFIILFIFYSLY